MDPGLHQTPGSLRVAVGFLRFYTSRNCQASISPSSSLPCKWLSTVRWNCSMSASVMYGRSPILSISSRNIIMLNVLKRAPVSIYAAAFAGRLYIRLGFGPGLPSCPQRLHNATYRPFHGRIIIELSLNEDNIASFMIQDKRQPGIIKPA